MPKITITKISSIIVKEFRKSAPSGAFAQLTPLLLPPVNSIIPRKKGERD
jgi:hypothetical protein